MVMHIAVSPLVTGPALPDVRPFDLLTPNPRDVLHVPKAHPAAN
jgi:hypothetical protein